ncbi:MAG: cytochrome c oxidase accessory protein CcoG [Hyphomicrobiales bacterium]|nr:cytochrome c oxidase accessory protein CcoG [Hyphomicrobiales bacterium]
MEESFYQEHIKVYPAAVQGTVRKVKWAIVAILLTIYYVMPFIRWDRGPGLPNQAVLADLPGRRFYFFFIEIWPQEVYYFTGLLITAAFTLFLLTAVAGRVWCGYLCWQTVWTDLFLAVERLIEGDRRDRIKLDEGPKNGAYFGKKLMKWIAWGFIAMATGGAWVLYFTDAPTLIVQLVTLQAPKIAYIWIGILTFTTWFFAGYMREQVCIYACPWPRIQAAMTDEYALNVSYRDDRGEPRASVKEGKKAKAAGQTVGDCVDCYQCVAVCPTGTDIRMGSQLSCIQCGLCIDACTSIMSKLGRPTGLIAYDTPINFDRRKQGLAPIYRVIRPRTILYAVLISGVLGFMAYTFISRGNAGVNVLHDRNPLYVQNSDGSVRNGYTIRLLNRVGHERHFLLSVEGVPASARLEVVGIDQNVDGRPLIHVGADQTREVRAAVLISGAELKDKSTDVVFRVTEQGGRETATAKDFFKAP